MNSTLQSRSIVATGAARGIGREAAERVPAAGHASFAADPDAGLGRVRADPSPVSWVGASARQPAA